MAGQTADAVVIGAGPNGLVAANALVDAGWDVVVLEANDEVGGAVRSAEVTAPGFVNDMFSAFYPLAAASPVIRDLDLGDHGLAWVQAETSSRTPWTTAGPRSSPPTPTRTAESVDAFAHGDGEAWLAMFEQWRRIRDPLLDALFTPFPPITSTVRLLRRLGTAGTVDLARLAVTPVRRLGQERFDGAGAALLLEGNAMHSDVPPDAAGSGVFGWLLAMLGQDVGFPVPAGGAQQLASSLQRRIVAGGGEVRTGAPRDLGRPVRWPRRRRAAAGRYDGHRPQGGPRRRPGARAVRRAGRARPPAGDVRARPGDVPVGQLDDQGQLGPRPAGALARRRRPRSRHGPPRRRLRRPRRLRRRPDGGPGAASGPSSSSAR